MVAGIALALLGLSAPADAANGNIGCTGIKYPKLTLGANGPGSGSWTNNAGSGYTPFTIPAGLRTFYSPYQSAHWVANASAGFYSGPSATCVS